MSVREIKEWTLLWEISSEHAIYCMQFHFISVSLPLCLGICFSDEDLISVTSAQGHFQNHTHTVLYRVIHTPRQKKFNKDIYFRKEQIHFCLHLQYKSIPSITRLLCVAKASAVICSWGTWMGKRKEQKNRMGKYERNKKCQKRKSVLQRSDQHNI